MANIIQNEENVESKIRIRSYEKILEIKTEVSHTGTI
jgi:hypothetical protein